MKFMITWQFHQGKLHEGYSHFFKMTAEQDAADRGSRIKQIGRWVELDRNSQRLVRKDIGDKLEQKRDLLRPKP